MRDQRGESEDQSAERGHAGRYARPQQKGEQQTLSPTRAAQVGHRGVRHVRAQQTLRAVSRYPISSSNCARPLEIR
jgi:hypothetical protein